MLRTDSGDTFWKDLTAFGNKAGQQLDIFKIYIRNFICTEFTDFSPAKIKFSAAETLVCLSSRSWGHNQPPFEC